MKKNILFDIVVVPGWEGDQWTFFLPFLMKNRSLFLYESIFVSNKAENKMKNFLKMTK